MKSRQYTDSILRSVIYISMIVFLIWVCPTIWLYILASLLLLALGYLAYTQRRRS